jgi:hypothetical protein
VSSAPHPPPASTALEVGALVWAGMLIEVDAAAVIELTEGPAREPAHAQTCSGSGRRR